jgi:endonuclease YncB( thermonuclease family)
MSSRAGRRRYTRRVKLAVVLCIAAVGACSRATAPAAGVAVVTRVVDGDTIEVAIGGHDERVRLLGIDTPELHVDGGPPECFGPEAADHTSSLLPPGTEVRLERDVVGRDHYGRLLAHVYRLPDGLLVNEELLRHGYARPLTIEPNHVFAKRFVAATVAAESDGFGLWTACAGR